MLKTETLDDGTKIHESDETFTKTYNVEHRDRPLDDHEVRTLIKNRVAERLDVSKTEINVYVEKVSENRYEVRVIYQK